MIRIYAILAAACLSCAVAPRATAATDFCEAQSRFVSGGLGELGVWIARAVPVDNVALAKSIRIVIEPSQEIGPFAAERDDVPVVVIPARFAVRHCRMAMQGMALIDKTPAFSPRVMRESVARCMRLRKAPVECIDEGLDAQWPALNQQLATLSADDTRTNRTLVNYSFRSLILHEVAHHIFGHLKEQQGDKRSVREMEFEADLFAAFFSALTGDGLIYANNFELLRQVEDLLPRSDDPHRSFACRADVGWLIAGRIAGPALSILSWPNPSFPGPVSDTQRARISEIAQGRDRNADLSEVTCDGGGYAVPRTMLADLRPLAMVQAPLLDSARPGDVRLGRRTVTALIDIPYQSDFGRYVRSRLIALYARHFQLYNTLDDMTWLFTTARVRTEKSYFIAGDYGQILANYTIARALAWGRDQDSSINPDDLHRDFEEAIYYDPDFPVAYLFDGIVYSRQFKCTEAMARFQKARAMVDDESRQMVDTHQIAAIEQYKREGRCLS